MSNTIIHLSWENCYDASWKNIASASSVVHPAKFARNLIKKIYDFAFEEGLLEEGSVIIDPFGGVALGSLDALLKGCHWVGCELEPRFAELAQENIDLWNKKYGKVMTRWGSAKIYTGDSRKLSQVLKENHALDGIVSSPPFVSSLGSTDKEFRAVGLGQGAGKWAQNRSPESVARLTADYGNSQGQLGAMSEGNLADAILSSPPFTQPQTRDRAPVQDGSVSDFMTRAYTVDHQGGSNGNLANLEMNGEDLRQQVDMIASSPPFVDALGNRPSHSLLAGSGGRMGISQKNDDYYGTSDGQLGAMKDRGVDAVLGSPPYASARIGNESGQSQVGHGANYGDSTGQLGSMPDGGLAKMVVKSPPFMDSGNEDHRKAYDFAKDKAINRDGYGNSNGQLGNESQDTFWSVAKVILQECFALLKDGGEAVRDGEEIEFCNC